MGRQRRPTAVEQKRFETAADMARALPHHFRPISDSPVLTSEERENLAQCEAAVDTLQWAFWLAGKALQIIRDGRLYRAGYANFPEYTQARWNMSEGQANKLIRTWRIAEALFELASNDSIPIGVVRRLNQAQAWELVPVAEQYDLDAVRHVYKATVEVDGEAVTAALIKGAVKALPRGKEFDAAKAEAAIRSALKREQSGARRRVPASRQSGAADAAGSGAEVGLPWRSPEALNRILREHMTPEDRAVLVKLLAD